MVLTLFLLLMASRMHRVDPQRLVVIDSMRLTVLFLPVAGWSGTSSLREGPLAQNESSRPQLAVRHMGPAIVRFRAMSRSVQSA